MAALFMIIMKTCYLHSANDAALMTDPDVPAKFCSCTATEVVSYANAWQVPLLLHDAGCIVRAAS